MKKSLHHLTELLPSGPALTLAGGVVLFFAGDAAFRAATLLRPLRFRACAAPVALATVFLGVGVCALAELLTLVAVLMVMLGVEARWGVLTARVGEPVHA